MPSSNFSRALIFHGYRATPTDHWFGWLAARLEAAGIRTQVPALPDPDHPDPQRWAAAAGAAIGVPGADTVVVAHSLGCLAALRYLAEAVGAGPDAAAGTATGAVAGPDAGPDADAAARARPDEGKAAGLTPAQPDRLGHLVLVSGFTERLPALPELDDFIGAGLDVSRLRESLGAVTVLRSDADALVPTTHTERLAHALVRATVVVPGAGHFMAEDGYTELPEAVTALGLG